MAMEKRGVCPDEGEEPVAGGITKAAVEDAINLPKRQCQGSCGCDPLSKLTDAVKQAGQDKPC